MIRDFSPMCVFIIPENKAKPQFWGKRNNLSVKATVVSPKTTEPKERL